MTRNIAFGALAAVLGAALFPGRPASGADARTLGPSEESPVKSFEAWKQSLFSTVEVLVKYYDGKVGSDIARKLTVPAGGQALRDAMEQWKKDFVQAKKVEVTEKKISDSERKLLIRSVVRDSVSGKNVVTFWDIPFVKEGGKWLMANYPQKTEKPKDEGGDYLEAGRAFHKAWEEAKEDAAREKALVAFRDAVLRLDVEKREKPAGDLIELYKKIPKSEKAGPVIFEGRELRAALLETIGRLKHRSAVAFLARELAQGQEPECRRAAALALGEVGDDDGLDALHAGLEKEIGEELLAVLEAVERIESSASIGPLIERLPGLKRRADMEAHSGLAQADRVSAQVLKRASGALTKMTGQKLGDDHKKWKAWWEENGKAFKTAKEKEEAQ